MTPTPGADPRDEASIVGRARRSVTQHPVVAGLLGGAVLAAVGVSALIGLPVVVTVVLLGLVGVGGLALFTLWRRRSTGHAWSPATAGRLGLAAVALSGVATFVVIQLVPYGRDHTNPPVTGEPQWADPRTRDLMVDACFSCHSNETEYPAYASVAPFSWAVQHHIDEGREAVNYSEFVTDPGEADESIEAIDEGEMPPAYYTRFGAHPEADLTEAELAELIDGLRRTPGLSDD